MSTQEDARNTANELENVPVIDLEHHTDDHIVEQLSHACRTWGFFQIVHHGIDPELIQAFREAGIDYFVQGNHQDQKRHAQNARGYFDDELTKQKRDWKQCIDIGVPGSRSWQLDDDDDQNACLDGFNQFPNATFPQFRKVVVDYFGALEELSDRLARLMAKGLGVEETHPLLDDLKQSHTSYLWLNYYPKTEQTLHSDDVLGINPHKDAGFLTILLQDESCHSLQVWHQNKWHTIQPAPNSFTINTGDMLQIWSNGAYQAPLHRVLTNDSKARFSAPFFYNPGYATSMAPIQAVVPKYRPCNWGYFRAVRFAGDFTDLGVEIQIDDYQTDHSSPHEYLQMKFGQHFLFHKPFNVEEFAIFLERQQQEKREKVGHKIHTE